MTSHDEFVRDMLWLMRAIKKESLAIPKEIEFTLIENQPDTPAVTTQRNMLRRLRGWHALSFEPNITPDTAPVNTFHLSIEQKQFNDLYSLFENGIKLNLEGSELYELVNRFVRPHSYSDKKTYEAWEIMSGRKLPQRSVTKEDNFAAPKPSLKLAPNTKWEDLELKFENKFDVEIRLKGKHLVSSNVDALGFTKSSTKAKTADKQWQLLQCLAVAYYFKNKQGRLMAEPTIEELARSLKSSKGAVMKIKEKLAKRLQETFSIDDDPFEPYADTGYYKIKFKLTPEPDLRREEPWQSGLSYNDNIGHDYLPDEDLEKLPE